MKGRKRKRMINEAFPNLIGQELEVPTKGLQIILYEYGSAEKVFVN